MIYGEHTLKITPAQKWIPEAPSVVQSPKPTFRLEKDDMSSIGQEIL